MKIIEMYLMSKSGNIENCEDAVIANNDFACVIDGVTSKSRRLRNGKTAGMMSSTLTSDAIKLFPGDIDSVSAIQSLTFHIAEFYKRNNIYNELLKNPKERFTSSVIIYSHYYNEIWMVGDCQCLVDNKLYTNNKVIDTILANVRAFYLELELITGKSVEDLIELDTGRAFIMPLLEKQSIFQNSHIDSVYSYGVIDGFDVQKDAIKTIKVEANTRYLVLASDGYPKLMSSLKESERILQELLRSDPLCIKHYKSTKGLSRDNISYDDRAYLKLKL